MRWQLDLLKISTIKINLRLNELVKKNGKPVLVEMWTENSFILF